MKTRITFSLLFIVSYGFCQIPSINETKTSLNKSAFVSEDLENLREKSYDSYKKHYEKIIKQKSDSIMILSIALEEAIGNIAKMDSITSIIDKKQKEVMIVENERDEKLSSFGKFKAFFPTIKKANRKQFFKSMYNNDTDKTSYINSFALSGDSNGASVQSEIITDNMSAFRVSLGTVITASADTAEEEAQTEEEAKQKAQDETEQDAFKRLINGGGNFYLEIILPIIVTNQNNGDQVTFYGYTKVKGAMDIKGFGNDIDTSTGNGSLGLNAYLGVSSDSKKFNFFLQSNVDYSFGTDDFYKNLGLKKEKAFLNGKIITGVALLNRFKISAIVSAFGSDEKLKRERIIIGVQILPGF